MSGTELGTNFALRMRNQMAALTKPSADSAQKLLTSLMYPFGRAAARHQSSSAEKERDNTRDGPRCVSRPSVSRLSVMETQSLLVTELSDYTRTDSSGAHSSDDGVGLISAEDYVQFRLMPAIHRLSATIPRHERYYVISQGVVLFATMMASICGVLGLHVWIPAVVALVAAVESGVYFDQTSARLLGANAALSQLKNLRIWWQSLSRTQQSLSNNKAQLVKSAEQAIESELSAWTQGLLRKMHNLEAELEVEGDSKRQLGYGVDVEAADSNRRSVRKAQSRDEGDEDEDEMY